MAEGAAVMENPLFYWIHFDKVGRPERIVVKDFLEFLDLLHRLVERTGEMPEWIQRGYK